MNSRLKIILAFIILVLAVGGTIGVWRLVSNSQRSVETDEQVPEQEQEPLDVAASQVKIEQVKALGAAAKDTDGDGLSDAQETGLKTDPKKVDTDGDGLSDFSEVYVAKTDPTKFDASFSARGNRPIPSVPTASTSSAPLKTPLTQPEDSDGDSLSDVQEAQLKTDPQKGDTDGDALPDGEEVNEYKTDPTRADTDGDSFLDGQEVKNGYNPRGAGACLSPGCLP
jgi:hypothetical protein